MKCSSRVSLTWQFEGLGLLRFDGTIQVGDVSWQYDNVPTGPACGAHSEIHPRAAYPCTDDLLLSAKRRSR